MALAKHIFVATDFSEGSNSAVDAAGELAREWGARVTLFHAFDPDPLIPPGAIPNPTQFREKIVNEMDSAVHAALDDAAKQRLSGVDVDCVVVQDGSAARAICEAAEKAGADLIVVATKGRTGLAHLLIGSVAERVVRHAHTTVLTVRLPES